MKDGLVVEAGGSTVGGIGVSVRYLERTGISRRQAVGAAAANTVAGAIVHVALLVAMAVLVGRGHIESVHLPDRWIALVVVVAGLAVAGLALGTVTGRRRLLEPTGRALSALAGLLPWIAAMQHAVTVGTDHR